MCEKIPISTKWNNIFVLHIFQDTRNKKKQSNKGAPPRTHAWPPSLLHTPHCRYIYICILLLYNPQNHHYVFFYLLYLNALFFNFCMSHLQKTPFYSDIFILSRFPPSSFIRYMHQRLHPRLSMTTVSISYPILLFFAFYTSNSLILVSGRRTPYLYNSFFHPHLLSLSMAT